MKEHSDPLIVEAVVPGMIVRGTPAQVRRAGDKLPESEAPELVNADPYGEGWLVELELETL